MSESIPIGALAEATGATVVAIRHYDDLGLVEVAARIGGKRRFSPSSVGRVNFIRRAQEAGFSLREIGSLLDDGLTTRDDLIAGKLDELRERRSRLDDMIELLDEIRDCGCEAVERCPAIPSGS